MKKKAEKIKEALLSESGIVTIVEAAYVFPIMFFIIFFMIYFGNMYYVKSTVDMIASSQAIKGAQYYANPWVEKVNKDYHGQKVPVRNDDVKPYRQIFSDSEIKRRIEQETLQRIQNVGGGGFAGMNPTNISCTAKHNNYVIYSSFEVGITYKITFPIKFIFSKDKMVADFSAYDLAAVSDNSEFIRDTDMAIDYVQRSNWYNSLKSKISEFLSKF